MVICGEIPQLVQYHGCINFLYLRQFIWMFLCRGPVAFRLCIFSLQKVVNEQPTARSAGDPFTTCLIAAEGSWLPLCDKCNIFSLNSGRNIKKGNLVYFQAVSALSYRLQINRAEKMRRNGMAMNMSSHPMTGMIARTI